MQNKIMNERHYLSRFPVQIKYAYYTHFRHLAKTFARYVIVLHAAATTGAHDERRFNSWFVEYNWASSRTTG